MAWVEIQHQVQEFLKQFEPWSPHEILARIAEETGELGREINHQFGPKPKKPEEAESTIGEEISDLLFATISLANNLKIDLDKEFPAVIAKYNQRDHDRFK